MTNNSTNNSRLMSIDALRGFDMMFIMGVASIIVCICKLLPGGETSWMAGQMEHVEWHGLAHHDTIFPMFLFIAGISFPFSLAKQRSKGFTTSATVRKILKRALILVALGIVYNGCFNLNFPLRFASVLGRIGLAWMFASLIFVFIGKRWVREVLAAALLIGYWLLLRIPAPDVPGADPLSIDGNFAGYVDRILLPGRLNEHDGRFDPCGLLGVIPSIVTAMLGNFTGEWVRKEKVSGGRKTMTMMAAAVLMAVIGILWSKSFPINKRLWSSTFVLVVGAFSLASFALFYYLIDVRGWRKWCFPFVVIGMNSITIYMAQRIFNFRSISDFFLSGAAGLCPEAWGRLILSIGYFIVSWLFLYFLYRKKIFIKI